MGIIQSKFPQADTVDTDHGLSTPVALTLKDLEHLYIRPQRLKIKEDSQVGEGGYGEVLLASLDRSSRNAREVAVKQLRAVGTKGDRKRLALRLARELKIWATLDHPNVLGLLGYYLSDNYEIAQLISVYMVNGNVSVYLKRKQPGTAMRLKFVQGVTAGIRYLHDFDPPIAHGDLKPANVLINDDLDAVICDFGVASFINEAASPSGLTTTQAMKGSLRYMIMSPELLLESEIKHTLPSDIWAWGCTAYEIFTDVEPYSEVKTNGAIIAEVIRKKPPGSIEQLLARLPQSEAWPPTLSESVVKCWDFDMGKRPSVTALIEDCNILSCELPNRPEKALDPPDSGAKRSSQVLSGSVLGNVVRALVFDDKLEDSDGPSIVPSAGEQGRARRPLSGRFAFAFGSQSQKSDACPEPSLVPEEVPSKPSILAARCDATTKSPSGSLDGGTSGNNIPSRLPCDTPSPFAPSEIEATPGVRALYHIGKPDHSGWMRKRGKNFNTWKLRYFVLKGTSLYYLKNLDDSKITGCIDITGYHRSVSYQYGQPGRYGFELTHKLKEKEPHYFNLTEEMVVREWMRALMKTMVQRDYSKPAFGSSINPSVSLSVAQAMWGSHLSRGVVGHASSPNPAGLQNSDQPQTCAPDDIQEVIMLPFPRHSVAS